MHSFGMRPDGSRTMAAVSEAQKFPPLGQLLAAAARRTLTRPFAGLLALSLFVALASSTVTDPDVAFLSAVLLIVVETYVEIAVILAASRTEPDPSIDPWVRAAFARRVFWRFLLTNLAAFIIVGFGFVALIVPGFIAAGAFGLAPVLAVLQNRLPGDALKGSRKLSASVFGLVAVSFGLLQAAPSLAIQVGVTLNPEGLAAVFTALNLVTVVLARVGTLALVDVFSRLGGKAEPRRERPGRPA